MKLVQAALELGGRDNVTVVVLRVSGVAAPAGSWSVFHKQFAQVSRGKKCNLLMRSAGATLAQAKPAAIKEITAPSAIVPGIAIAFPFNFIMSISSIYFMG